MITHDNKYANPCSRNSLSNIFRSWRHMGSKEGTGWDEWMSKRVEGVWSPTLPAVSKRTASHLERISPPVPLRPRTTGVPPASESVSSTHVGYGRATAIILNEQIQRLSPEDSSALRLVVHFSCFSFPPQPHIITLSRRVLL